jgi:hypothetical protein
MLIVIDEAETILRMRADSRHKSLNGIRQIADLSPYYPGLVWLFTGTPDFFDLRQGVAGLAPLHDRIRFIKVKDHASLRQAQLELTPFKPERLRAVAMALRAIFPTSQRESFEAKISNAFIDRLVAEVTAGFKKDKGVVPRQFLREFVNQMDLVDEDASYDPMVAYDFTPAQLSPEEQFAVSGLEIPDAEDGPVPQEDVW